MKQRTQPCGHVECRTVCATKLSLVPYYIFQINSPVQLSDGDLELSYLSLQPPPGRLLDDTIQFETLDLYLWTGEDFADPSLLFYAGPVYDEETDNIDDQEGEPSNEVRTYDM